MYNRNAKAHYNMQLNLCAEIFLFHCYTYIGTSCLSACLMHTSLFNFRHTIKPSAADRRKKEEDGDLHLANKIMHNKQYNMIKTIEDEYDYGDAPSKKGKRKNKEAHEEKRSSRGHILTQKERCLYCFENSSRPKHLAVAIGNFTYLMLPQFEPLVPGHCIILPLQVRQFTMYCTMDRKYFLNFPLYIS